MVMRRVSVAVTSTYGHEYVGYLTSVVRYYSSIDFVLNVQRPGNQCNLYQFGSRTARIDSINVTYDIVNITKQYSWSERDQGRAILLLTALAMEDTEDEEMIDRVLMYKFDLEELLLRLDTSKGTGMTGFRIGELRERLASIALCLEGCVLKCESIDLPEYLEIMNSVNRTLLHLKDSKTVTHEERKKIRTFFGYLVSRLAQTHGMLSEDESAERYMANSPKYSKPMKVVVSRDGNGQRHYHYEVRSPLLKMDTDDQWAVKEFMPDYEEFLLDEDGKRMEDNLREVSVREVRLGKIIAKASVEMVPEMVIKKV